MARRRGAMLGVVGSGLMAMSLLWPVLVLDAEDATQDAEFWIMPVLVATSFLLSLARSEWACFPALIWLGIGWPVIFGLVLFEVWRSPLLLAHVLAYVSGGVCVLVASVRAGRARRQTDVSAFD